MVLLDVLLCSIVGVQGVIFISSVMCVVENGPERDLGAGRISCLIYINDGLTNLYTLPISMYENGNI